MTPEDIAREAARSRAELDERISREIHASRTRLYASRTRQLYVLTAIGLVIWIAGLALWIYTLVTR